MVVALICSLAVDLQIHLVPANLLLVAIAAAVTYAICLRRGHTLELQSTIGGAFPIPARRRLQLHFGLVLLLGWLGAYVWILGPHNIQAVVRGGLLIAIAGVLTDIALIDFASTPTQRWVATILLELTAATLILKGSVYFGTPGVPGLDTWFHLSVIQDVLGTGQIPATLYTDFPLFHVGGAAIGMMSGLDAKSSMFIVGAFAESLAPVFGYLVARQFAAPRTSLLVGVAVGFSFWEIRWGFWTIAMTLGVLFFSAGIYVVVRLGRERASKASGIAILLLLAVAINATHPTAAFIFALTLSALAAIGLVLRHRGSRQPFGSGTTRTTLIWVILIAYWLYISGTVPMFVLFFQRSLVFDRTLSGLSDVNSGGSQMLAIWDHMPFYLLGYLSLVGCLLAVTTKKRRELGLFCLTGFVLVGVSLYLDQTALTNGYGDRLAVFGEFLLEPALVIGVIAVTGFIRSPKARRSVLVVILLLFISVSLVNYQTSTQPAFLHATDSPTQLSTPEMTSAQDAAGLAKGQIAADPLTGTFLTWSAGRLTRAIFDPTQPMSGVVVFRTDLQSTTTWKEPLGRLDACSCSTRFFDSGALVAYQATGYP